MCCWKWSGGQVEGQWPLDVQQVQMNVCIVAAQIVWLPGSHFQKCTLHHHGLFGECEWNKVEVKLKWEALTSASVWTVLPHQNYAGTLQKRRWSIGYSTNTSYWFTPWLCSVSRVLTTNSTSVSNSYHCIPTNPIRKLVYGVPAFIRLQL